jgi:hypothetical protein
MDCASGREVLLSAGPSNSLKGHDSRAAAAPHSGPLTFGKEDKGIVGSVWRGRELQLVWRVNDRVAAFDGEGTRADDGCLILEHHVPE